MNAGIFNGLLTPLGMLGPGTYNDQVAVSMVIAHLATSLNIASYTFSQWHDPDITQQHMS